MVAVSTVDGIKYGVRLLGYLLAVVIAGGLLILIGTGFSPGPYNRGNPVLVVVFAVAGLAVIYAGGLGMLYKVIADGVQIGTIAAEHGGPVAPESPGVGHPVSGQAGADVAGSGQPQAADQRTVQQHPQGTTVENPQGATDGQGGQGSQGGQDGQDHQGGRDDGAADVDRHDEH